MMFDLKGLVEAIVLIGICIALAGAAVGATIVYFLT
jgi:hypothetical protein